MAKNFLEINNGSYLLDYLTYNSETKILTVLTDRVGDWKKSTLSALKYQSAIRLLKAFTSTRRQKT